MNRVLNESKINTFGLVVFVKKKKKKKGTPSLLWELAANYCLGTQASPIQEELLDFR